MAAAPPQAIRRRHCVEVEAELVHRGDQGSHRPTRVAALVAKRMGAPTVETDSSHVPMLSKPPIVLDVIRKAAKAVQND
jgi:hypothetical protein